MAAAVQFDAVVLSSMLLRRLPLPSSIPIVGDTHNVEYDVHRRTAAAADSRARRTYARLQGASTKAEEARCGRAVDLVLATSVRDRSLFEQELGLDNVAVIPNGIDLQEFAPCPSPASNSEIVFTGLMAYYPNEQAVRWFLDNVFPSIKARLPAARFTIVGAKPPAWLLRERGSDVDVTGEVPDVRPYLARARAVVVPLKIGGGTRVKILEAQAMGKPVVSTTIGAEGLGQTHDQSILIADEAPAFAQRVVDVLIDPCAASRIGAAGRAQVIEHFDWERIGRQLAALLERRFALTPVERHGAS
jgi:glycosyltransferase involved in cell wall biosynthesis